MEITNKGTHSFGLITLRFVFVIVNYNQKIIQKHFELRAMGTIG
jgi:hypothetical protein